MKRWGYMLVGLMVGAVVLVAGVQRPVEAANSHKQITLRGKGLASIVWVGGLFSTAAYDTTDYPNARPEQSRALRGPLLCWGLNGQLVSAGSNAVNGTLFVSVFIQHSPTGLESEWTNLLYLASSRRGLRNSNLQDDSTGGLGGPSLASTTTVGEMTLGATADSSFGRYIRARFATSTTGANGVTLASSYGVQYAVICDTSGDSLIR